MGATAGLEPASSLPILCDCDIHRMQKAGRSVQLSYAAIGHLVVASAARRKRAPGLATLRRISRASYSAFRNSGSSALSLRTRPIRSCSLLSWPLIYSASLPVARSQPSLALR